MLLDIFCKKKKSASVSKLDKISCLYQHTLGNKYYTVSLGCYLQVFVPFNAYILPQKVQVVHLLVIFFQQKSLSSNQYFTVRCCLYLKLFWKMFLVKNYKPPPWWFQPSDEEQYNKMISIIDGEDKDLLTGADH